MSVLHLSKKFVNANLLIFYVFANWMCLVRFVAVHGLFHPLPRNSFLGSKARILCVTFQPFWRDSLAVLLHQVLLILLTNRAMLTCAMHQNSQLTELPAECWSHNFSSLLTVLTNKNGQLVNISDTLINFSVCLGHCTFTIEFYRALLCFFCLFKCVLSPRPETSTQSINSSNDVT